MKKISIVIPVYNEQKTIKEIMRQVVIAPALNYKKEIIVINDGSQDNTKEILNRLQDEFDFIYLEHAKNKGKGAVIKTALDYVSGDYVLIQDADLEYNPEEYLHLLNKLDDKSIIVYGSRNLKPKQKGYFHCALGAGLLTFLTNILFGSKLTDIYTCYKVIPSQLLKSLNLESNRFEIEAEITSKLLKRGYQIQEVAISYSPRAYRQGKKIHIRDGLKSIWTIVKNRFT